MLRNVLNRHDSEDARGNHGWGESDVVEILISYCTLALPPLCFRRVGITSSKIKGFTLGTHTKSRFQKHKEEVCPSPLSFSARL